MPSQPKIKVLFIAAVSEDRKRPFMPTFIALMVSVDKQAYNDGEQFVLAEAMLKRRRYGEPYLLYTEEELPKWMMAAFRRGNIKGVTPAAYRKAVAQRERVFAEEVG